MPRIFISYRHADSEGHVGRLYDHLSRVFDGKEIFRDLDSLQGGEEFSPTCEKAVEACDVFLAVIGPTWLNISDDKGRRLDNPRDIVRQEIATALKQKKRVIPVLVGRASIAKSKDLPDEIATLFQHNAIEISPERFAYDVERLIQAIGGAYGKVQVFNSSTSLFRTVPYQEETFQVRIDGNPVGEITKDSKSVTASIEAGMHNICVRCRQHEWEKFRESSNELRFELKGGQTIYFSFERGPAKPPLMPKGLLILKHHQPVAKL